MSLRIGTLADNPILKKKEKKKKHHEEKERKRKRKGRKGEKEKINLCGQEQPGRQFLYFTDRRDAVSFPGRYESFVVFTCI